MTSSPSAAGPTSAPSNTEPGMFTPLRLAIAIGVVMVLLALTGVGLASARPKMGRIYWISMVPTFGLLCVATAYFTARKGQFELGQVYRQALHWLGITAAMCIDFAVLRSGAESEQAAGMVALLLLAVGCFTAGVHFQWLFMLVGVLLAVTLCVIAVAEEYMWLIFVAGICVVLLMLALPRLFHSRR